MLLPFIHWLPFIKPFIFHPHPSFYFTVLHHCPWWVCVEKFHLSASPSRVTEPIGPRGQTSNGLGSPNVCARIGAGLLQDKEKGLPAMTNGYLRINMQVRRGGEGGRRKSAESLFHHPSVSFGPLINLWTLLLPLFQCRTPFSIHCLW